MNELSSGPVTPRAPWKLWAARVVAFATAFVILRSVAPGALTAAALAAAALILDALATALYERGRLVDVALRRLKALDTLLSPAGAEPAGAPDAPVDAPAAGEPLDAARRPLGLPRGR